MNKFIISSVLISYLIIMVVAEAVISYYAKLGLGAPYLGMGIHASIILLLLLFSFSSAKKYSLFISAMAFPPLIRLLSTALVNFQFIYTIIIINVLLIITAYLFIKNNSMTSKEVGFCTGNIKWQLCIGATGILLGFTEYSILGEYRIISETSLPTLIASALALLIFTGFSEELVFRGIILTTAENVLGKNYALIFISVVFMIMHVIWMNLWDLLFVFLVALFYGYAFQRTRSLFGITLSHGLSNIMLFLVIPAVI